MNTPPPAEVQLGQGVTYMTTERDRLANLVRNVIDGGMQRWEQTAQQRRDFGAGMAARGIKHRQENAGVTQAQATDCLRLAIEEDLGAPLEGSLL
jgi:hypothetical protein